MTGLALGGNKARKLEFDFAEVLNGGYDTVITAGGAQSNHARMTAAACRKLGLDCKLVLGGADFTYPKGNLLLDALFNAGIRYILDDDANDHLTAEMERWAVELRSAGRNPYLLPIGGSTGLGALGYVDAMHELAGQGNFTNAQIVVGVGSCGTFAGMVLGAHFFLPEARVIGISVSRSVQAINSRTKELIQEAAGLLKVSVDREQLHIECYDEFFGEYGVMTDSGKAAIETCANLEGVLLDPIYTGKVMAGLLQLVEREIITVSQPVVFMHTGGSPILFTFENELSNNLYCRKI